MILPSLLLLSHRTVNGAGVGTQISGKDCASEVKCRASG